MPIKNKIQTGINQYKLIFISVLFFGLFGLAKGSQAANWYVDNSVGSSGNGTSWGTAWKNFSNIVWGASGARAGDTLYISGGDTTQTYTEQLYIGASGSNGSPITVSVGQDAGHNGVAIIDGQLTRSSAISVSGRSYIKITGQVGTSKNLRLTGGTQAGLWFYGATNNFQATYLEIYSNGNGTDKDGITGSVDYNTNANIEIDHCDIHDNWQDGIHLVQSTAGEATQFGVNKIHDNHIYHYNDDGIELALGADVYNNDIGERIVGGGTGHPDGIQFFNSYTRVFNNYFHEQVLAAFPNTSNSNIFADPFSSFITLNPKYIYIFNNLIVEPNLPGTEDFHRGISVKFAETGVASANHILVANNTLVGIPYFGLSLTMASLGTAAVSDIKIENNIFKDIGYYNPVVMLLETGDGTITYGSSGASADVIVDNNMVYASSSSYKTDIGWNNVFYPYATYKTLSGCDAHGSINNPLLDSNYALSTGSPAIDHGDSLGAYFTTDKNGTSRPQGSGWDMGAFEYASGSDTTPPAAPSGLAVN